MKNTFAKIIRIISVPPVMITFLLVILNTTRPDIFRNNVEVLTSIILLGIVPVLAYPFQLLSSSLEDRGRIMQRKLAFIFSLIGYATALLWAILVHTSIELLMICATYFISVVILTFFNKVLKKRASGHACSITGPLVFLIYLVDWKLIFPCLIIATLIFWSSLYLQRYTKTDLFYGVLSNLLAFALSFIIIMR